MFGFGEKAKKKKWVIETGIKVLGVQIELSRSVGQDTLKERSMDQFFHGYIFGFIDSLLQMANIDDQRESLEIMGEIHENIFYSGVGTKILEMHIDLQGSEVFTSGILKGGDEAHEFLASGDTPMGLSTFIQNGTE